MEKLILLQQNVTDYLNSLVEVLFEKNYFGFEDSAQVYVSKIYDFIENELTKIPSKKSPEELTRFGYKYVFYRANERTTLYIFLKKRTIAIW